MWATALVGSDQLWVAALDRYINGCCCCVFFFFFFWCVFGGGSFGGTMVVVWWVWCKKVYSMVVFGMGMLGCF